MSAQTINGEFDERCVWQFPERCPNKGQWQVKGTNNDPVRVCHGHLTETCQTLVVHAPLVVEPIFGNWGSHSILDS